MITLTRDNEIGIITIDSAPVNALSPDVLTGIEDCYDEALSNDSIKGIVLIGAGRTFVAGADINEFGKIVSGERKEEINFHTLFDKIEQSPKPTTAAIHGSALGGGLELAMACHYRVALPTAQVGQPEVKLGLIPGAAGTQRLPRLAGVSKALTLCVDGNPINAKEAFICDIVDEIVDGNEANLLLYAIAYTRAKLNVAPPRSCDRDEKLKEFDPTIFNKTRATAAKNYRGQTAPLAAIEAIEAATTLPFKEGCDKEAELFKKCLFSEQSKSLIHIFFGEREVAKIPDIPKDIKPKDIKKAAIVGAGTMGGGIAMVYANAGIPVLIKESDEKALERGLENIRKNYQNSVKKGRFTKDEMKGRIALITPSLTYDGFEDVDIVVEAVFENMAIKKQVFADLDKICKPDAILATNTSTLNIDVIAASTSRPESVIGNHFFSPANVMKLLEIVKGKATSKEAIATSMALAKKLKKTGVLAGNCFGFIGNRMFFEYLREVHLLIEEGATPQNIDNALYKFGMAMGPLAVCDLVGLDVNWRVRQERGPNTNPDVSEPVIEDKLYDLGRYGQKTGSGWYKYDENRKPSHDPVVDELIEIVSAELGIKRRNISEDEIIERTQAALINEGNKILDEGIALRPIDIDIIFVYGYGYPSWRGGPMHYSMTL